MRLTVYCVYVSSKLTKKKYPIPYWSYSSLTTYLRNPLAWYKRYVERVYDMPSSPAAAVGRAGHVALEHFYGGLTAAASTSLGLEYLRGVPDYEIAFGKAVSRRAQADKRRAMEAEYLQAIGFYLARPPRHKVFGVEFSGIAPVTGAPLPVKAISDLVIASRGNPGCIDIVDHKFVDTFSALREDKPLFVLQALFNYCTVSAEFKKPVKRFIVYECRKRENRDGSSQLRRYVLEYDTLAEEYAVFVRLLNDASEDVRTRRSFLPNPTDLFDGAHSFELYRMGLVS